MSDPFSDDEQPDELDEPFVKPALEYIRARVNETFNKEISGPAQKVAEDIWKNWDEIRDAVSEGDILLVADPFFHSVKYPSLSNFHMFRGAGIILLGTGVVTAIVGAALASMFGPVLWQGALVCLAIGAGAIFWGRYVQERDARTYRKRMVERVAWHQEDGGIADLCVEYLSGSIGFEGPHGRTFWPQFPSNALTGKKRIADGRDLRKISE
ncbi:MAG: hypothetical protein CL569_17245 [Alphaproteobacteria bacterium]|nr:hypothetical protein [Alphaproteobacteria bacterium]|tara:strand:+ start:110 stop:742 length:633 start_codon:yes stop_codon:yes gene_type:complete